MENKIDKIENLISKLKPGSKLNDSEILKLVESGPVNMSNY